MKQKGLIWFRSDLRLHDNEAVVEALAHCSELDMVYIFDKRTWEGKTDLGFEKIGAHRKRFLIESVKNLEASIHAKNGTLHVMEGYPEDILADWVVKHKTSWIFCNRERTYEEVKVQDRLEKKLWALGREMRYSRGKMLYHTADLPFPITHTPDQFTAFRKEVEKITPIRAPLAEPDQLHCSQIPAIVEYPDFEQAEQETKSGVFSFKGGTDAALNRIHSFFWEFKGLQFYKQTRNGLLGANFSSRLSPWLADGSLSPKLIYAQLRKFEKEIVANDSTYWLYFELVWRDFFRFMAKKHGNAIFLENGYSQNPHHAGEMNWEKFWRWANGTTGTPLVDAAMRELNQTGWISNRARQIVASFLINDLKLYWLMGAEYFESLLIDYDPCSNYGNWCYLAGVGSDTRSDRYFNILSQAKKYDPKGEYAQFWLPELAELSEAKIHTVDQLSAKQWQDCGIEHDSVFRKPLVPSSRWS